MRQRQQTYRYIGQPILFTDDGTAYYHVNNGQMLVPPIEDVERFNPREPRAGGQRLLTNQQEHDVNTALSQYFIRDDYEEVDFLNHLQDLVHLNDEDAGDMAISTSLNNLVIDATRERDYRQANNGRPSQLSQIQYDFLRRTNLYIDAGGHRYNNEPIQTIEGGQLAYVSQLSAVNDYQVIPTDEEINSLIEAGRYSLPETPEYGPDVPDDLEDPTIPDEDVEEIQEDLRRPDIIDAPPIVPGTTQPIDPITQDPISVPTPADQVERYQQYFNDNQSLYIGFREQFRNILPVFTGAMGGYFAFSIQKIRERGTIIEILNQEIDLINQLEDRLEHLSDNLQEEKINLQQSQEALERKQRVLGSYRESARVEKSIGREAQLRGVERFQEQVNQLLLEVAQAQTITDSIEMDIANEDATQSAIYDRLNNLINLDYTILQDVNRYSPQILTGVSIGSTLGLVLSGYLFPTYERIDEPYILADNIEYRPPNRDIHKEKKKEKPFNIQAPAEIKSGSINSRLNKKEEVKSFIPVKNNMRGKPLSYKEIQEYKSTLSTIELQSLKGKYLIFGDDNNISRVDDKCKSVVREQQIFKKPIM